MKRRFVLTKEIKDEVCTGHIWVGNSSYEVLGKDKDVLGGGFCERNGDYFCIYYQKDAINPPPLRYLFDELIIHAIGFLKGECSKLAFAYSLRDPLDQIHVEYPIRTLLTEKVEINNDILEDLL